MTHLLLHCGFGFMENIQAIVSRTSHCCLLPWEPDNTLKPDLLIEWLIGSRGSSTGNTWSGKGMSAARRWVQVTVGGQRDLVGVRARLTWTNCWGVARSLLSQWPATMCAVGGGHTETSATLPAFPAGGRTHTPGWPLLTWSWFYWARWNR